MNPTELREQINKLFNEQEIQLLCFDLGFDYENLAGKTKHGKTQSLIQECLRKNRIKHLLVVCRKKRPLWDWTWGGIPMMTGSAQNLDEMFERAVRQSLLADSADELRETLRQLEKVESIDPYYPGLSTQMTRIRQAVAYETMPFRNMPYVMAGIISSIVLVIVVAGFIINANNQNKVYAVIQTAEAATALAAIPPSKIPSPIPTTTPSSTPSPTATNTPTHTPTITPSPTATATFTPFPTGSDNISLDDTQGTARALEPATIFPAPVDSGSSAQLPFVDTDEFVGVLGRNTTGSWLYIRDKNGNEGFVWGEFFEYPGEVNELPVVSPLTADVYYLEGSCSNDVWTRPIFMEGRGGDGRYTYYWNGDHKAGPTSGSTTFNISNDGGAIIGTARIESGGGQVVEQLLYIPAVTCDD